MVGFKKSGESGSKFGQAGHAKKQPDFGLARAGAKIRYIPSLCVNNVV